MIQWGPRSQLMSDTTHPGPVSNLSYSRILDGVNDCYGTCMISIDVCKAAAALGPSALPEDWHGVDWRANSI